MSGFPISEATPVAFTDPLPASCDLVIVGGGIIGICAAIFAADRGLKVVVCEKGRVAGEQSSRNWGWIRQQGRDLGELPIVMESIRLWNAFQAELGRDVMGLRWSGILKASRTDAHLARSEQWLRLARPFGVDTRILTRTEMQDMLPGAAAPFAGGLFTPSDGRAEPWVTVPALARLAQARGVVIREGCAVRRLEMAAGQIAGVETERGRIGAAQVIVAAGSWSRLFLAQHGVKIPQLSVLASVAATEPVAGLPDLAFSDGDYAIRPRADGGLTLGPGSEHDFSIGPDAFASFFPYLPTLRRDFRSTNFRPWPPRGYPDGWTTPRRWQGESPFEAMRVLAPRPNMATLGRAHAAFRKAFPGAGPLRFRTAWAGMIDTLPDVVPVIDRVAALPGLILATGMAGHGFGIGPGVGRVLADIAIGQPPGHDLSRFRFVRFAEGGPPDFGAAL
ncbi:MAG: FAD-binding oxidoreductase [Rhodobacterales bacterium]|nr:FAD-binding oxidoreductase [Rhodobacterales bacterium]MDX5501448.1 FAD-binding oxidoreductase [Rhodobacterales bacterium]